MLKLEVLGAKHGDCLIIHYGAEASPRRILVDGGPPGVYLRHLRPRLFELRDENGKPPIFELAMVSHIDQDHIKGLLDLTNEMIQKQGTNQDPAVIKRFWHNSFTDITGGAEPAALTTASNAIVASIEAGGQTPFPQLMGTDGRAEHILAGIDQGRQLRGNLEQLGLDGNRPFDEQLVMWDKEADLPGGMSLKIIGPDKDRLIDLQQKWNPSLSASEVAAMTDKSVANLSSIVAMVEYEEKRILLTGDARGDDIISWLEHADMIVDGKCHVKIHKQQHHASDRNVDRHFFETVTADCYVFCGDGKHDNPDPSTLEMLREARVGDEYEIVFSNFVTMEHSQKQPEFNKQLGLLRDNGVTLRVRHNDQHSIFVEL